MAARLLPWLSGGGSCSELDSVSSLSLLHSIYGSQVSQVLFVSEDELNEREESSPSQRPGSGLPRQSRRPKSASGVTSLERQGMMRRPATARVRGSAAAPLAAVRPKSALPIKVPSSVELEEVSRSAIHSTKPVTLTRIPEYVNFWQGKPLSEREQTVPSHTRKAWKRPKSDYGLHFRPRSGSSKALATVLEGGDDCYGGTDNSDDHTKGQANGSQQGKSSSGWLFSGGKGSGSHLKRKDGGNGKGEKGTGREGSGNKAGRSVAASMWSQRAQRTRRKMSTASSSGGDSDLLCQDLEAHSFFLDVGGSYSIKTTRFELPMDIKLLEGMSPLQYLKSHCIVSHQHMSLCSRVFRKHDKDRDAHLSKQEVQEALQEALHGRLSPGQTEHLLQLVCYSADIRADMQLFAALCCLAGRTFSIHLLPALAEKDLIECVDFEALDWKLRGCPIQPHLRTLFSLL